MIVINAQEQYGKPYGTMTIEDGWKGLGEIALPRPLPLFDGIHIAAINAGRGLGRAWPPEIPLPPIFG